MGWVGLGWVGADDDLVVGHTTKRAVRTRCSCWFVYTVFTPGPGPAVYQDPRQTFRGMYNSPAYSMRCLCAPKPPFVTPGPPTYRYEDYPPYMESRAPIYTMAARTRYPLVLLMHCVAFRRSFCGTPKTKLHHGTSTVANRCQVSLTDDGRQFMTLSVQLCV